MFGVKDGFDIVIGNPPYIQLQKNGGELGKMYEKCGYKTFASTGDIYSLFYERGIQLLKTGGHLCFITSNKWMRAGYGEKTREFFSKNTNPVLLVDFAGVKIFESATVDTNILLLETGKNQKKTFACIAKDKSCRDNWENMIYNELLRRGYKVDVGVVEVEKMTNGVRKQSQYEIDFVINTGSERIYIQSALNVGTDEKKQQETFSLRNTRDSFRKIVILDGNIRPWTDDDGVCYMGVIPFLLRELI